MNASARRLLRPADLLLILCLITAAILLFVYQSTRDPGGMAMVERRGEVLLRIDLQDTTLRSYPIDGEYTLTVVTENGCVWIENASCPDHVCEQSGKLSAAGEITACLPAEIVLRVTGTHILDGVTG